MVLSLFARKPFDIGYVCHCLRPGASRSGLQPDLIYVAMPLSVNDGYTQREASVCSFAHEQLKIFDKTNHDHHRRSCDAGEEHYLKQTHEKDSDQHKA